MSSEFELIATAAFELAGRLPYGALAALSESLRANSASDWSTAKGSILRCLSTPEFRDSGECFLDLWKFHSPGVSSNEAAMVLMTAAVAHQNNKMSGIEVVWTGPEPSGACFRQTEQAILEVIHSARRQLTVVSYAVYRIPRIAEALVEAASRGVRIRFIVETPNLVEGKDAYDCVRALGDNVAAVASVYYWPQENRGKDDNGKIGIMHVKCAIADGARLFVSSANFTEYAFNINMELGLAVTGGEIPVQIEAHFDRLVENGLLARL